MGLMPSIRRIVYVWSWRLRYWWLDTQSGQIAQWAALAMLGLLALLQIVNRLIQAATSTADEPAKAFIDLLVAIFTLGAVSYALRPKLPSAAAPETGDVPTTEDGLAAQHHFGECWIEDQFQLAHKVVGKQAIQTKGGGKK